MHGQRLELNQSQKLMMTPMMQQAVMLLQMSALELQEFIEQEMLENPLLEDGQNAEEPEVDPRELSTETELSEEQKEKSAVEHEAEAVEKEIAQDQAAEDAAQIAEDMKAEIDWEQLFGDDYDRVSIERDPNQEAPSMEGMVTSAESLEEHLLRQIRLTTSAEEDFVAASLICSAINEDGYLAAPLEELGAGSSVPMEIFEGMLERVQRMDPVGVGARNLRECLLIQLKVQGLEDSDAWRIIDQHMEDLEKNRLPQIARAMGIDVDEVKSAVEVIQSLEPRPGRRFDATETKYVTPDVMVDLVDGEYIITLNQEWMPRLRISPAYWRMYQEIKRQKEKGEIKDFLKNKFNSAMWLIKSIDQRQSTLYKVSAAIVKYQRDFFDYGIKFLRPLTLRQIADEIEMHESTVSRVTTNKYMQTPRGTFELKYFFSSSIETDAGEDASSRSIKAIIKDIVGAEDASRPLSDQKITDILQKRGFNLARRTVTKYRKQLQIPSASRRRQY